MGAVVTVFVLLVRAVVLGVFFRVAFEFGGFVLADDPIGVFEVGLQDLHVELEFEAGAVLRLLQGLRTGVGSISVGLVIFSLVLDLQLLGPPPRRSLLNKCHTLLIPTGLKLIVTLDCALLIGHFLV